MAGGNSAAGTPPLATYDRNGNRIAKDLENGTATGYTYDMDTTGSWERPGEPAEGSPTASIRGSERVNCPAVGSRTPKALTDATGTLVESYTYDAFGTPSIFDASGSALPASPRENRFLFTGREWLVETATCDYGNRAYNATLGRFLQTDPIRFDAGDVNLFRYVSNNPLNAVDPTGRLKLPRWLNRAACLAVALKNHRASLDGAEKKLRTCLDTCSSYRCPSDREACIKACIKNCLGIHTLQVAKAAIEYAVASLGCMTFFTQEPWEDPYPFPGGPLPLPPPN